MPTKSKKTKSNKTSEVTFYPSFQALAEAAKDREKFETPPSPPRPRTLRSAADYPRRPVEWLWPEKIPLGKVTLLIGDPGLGKTLVALDVAARTSRGLAFPSNQPPALPGVCLGEPARNAQTNDVSHIKNANHPHPTTDPRQSRGLTDEHAPDSTLSAPGSVLILSANDEIADTIRPRLDAHGADPAKIFFDSDVTDLRHDLAHLEATLDEIPDCRLIIVDPVNAFVGPSDSHFHTIVRKVLAPLAELAAKRRVAILAVTHLRKNTGRAIQSAAGSMGFVAAARTVWTICRDPADARRTLLLPVKNNVGPLPAGLAFSIETHPEIDAPVVRWDSLPVATTAEEVGKPLPKPRGPEAEDRQAASEWLSIALGARSRRASDVIDEGRQLGFNPRTLRRGLYAIGGRTTFGGILNGWCWSLSATQSLPAAKSPPVDQSPFIVQPSAATRQLTVALEPDPQHTPSTVDHRPTEKKLVPLKVTCPLTENDDVQSTIKYLVPLSKTNIQPSPPESAPQSSRQADRYETHPPPFPSPKPAHPLNGHPLIDQILWRLRAHADKSTSAAIQPNSQRPTTTNKKSARSHSRLPTGTDSWHFTRQANSCEPAAMHLRDVSAQAMDESTSRRREDAV